jgi:hypothetical protein
LSPIRGFASQLQCSTDERRVRVNWHGCVVVSVVIGSLCSGVPSTAAETNATGAPMFSLAGGVGNSLGWLGVQGERHVREGRFSIFAGVGYGSTFDESPNASGTAAVAAGGRAFFGGRTHRFFVEGSVALIAREWWVDASGTEQQADRYGPGLQVGYQLLSRKGITFMTSVGVGYAVGAHFDTTL